MKQYVLCYAESIDNPDIDWIVLINKSFPHWQNGKLNFPGGAVRDQETVIKAAGRILEETTGLIADFGEVLGTMHGIDWHVSVVLCPFHGPFSVKYDGGERPLVTSLREALCMGSRILPELRTILPLCIARQQWQMILSEDRNWFNYVLQVNDQ
jgi:ADP-ribose pyrophosphatase YjhB (NUDIX family)